MQYRFIPKKGTNIVHLGITRLETETIFNKKPKQFVKGNIVDDFRFCHVFYDELGYSKAIEFFEPTEVLFNEMTLIGEKLDKVKRVFEEDNHLLVDASGFVSQKYQIGIYAPDDTVEAVLVGEDGYYDSLGDNILCSKGMQIKNEKAISDNSSDFQRREQMKIIIQQPITINGKFRKSIVKEFESNVLPNVGFMISDSFWTNPFSYEVKKVLINYEEGYCSVQVDSNFDFGNNDEFKDFLKQANEYGWE